jgi:hypothetical protein
LRIGSSENDLLIGREHGSHLQAGELRHINIQEDDICSLLPQKVQRLKGIIQGGFQLKERYLANMVLQQLQGMGFVFYYDAG